MSSSSTPYATRGLPPPPNVSMCTIPMAGLLVDVYGLDELSSPSIPITCLWLLHPRTRERSRMSDIAARTITAWNAQQGSSSSRRGLVALAFDMPNHGSRLVSEAANNAWDRGNEQHAVDMAGMVKGGTGDMRGLMDLVAGYLRREVDAHLCLGWSLGGHSSWQAWIGEERIDAAVVVIGCPDYMDLMSSRAALAELDTGGSFIGSKYFPQSLVEVCLANDPKGILFGTQPVPSLPLSSNEQNRLREILDRRVRGKKLLLCSGADDKLVPYANGKAVIEVLKDAAGSGWYKEMSVDDRVYDGVGHAFSKDMVEDAVQFLVEAVERGPRSKKDRAHI